MFELTKYIIGMVLITMMVSGILLFYTGGVEQYSPTGFNDTNLQNIANTINTVENATGETKTDVLSIDSDSSLLDIFGFIFSLGISAVKTMATGFWTFFVLVYSSVAEIPYIGEYANVLIVGFSTIIVLIFIGVMFKIIFKVE